MLCSFAGARKVFPLLKASTESLGTSLLALGVAMLVRWT